MGREFIEGENDGDRDNVEEPGLQNDSERVTAAGEFVADKLKCQKTEKSTSIRSQHGHKVPGRRGRPLGTTAQLHFDKAKSKT